MAQDNPVRNGRAGRNYNTSLHQLGQGVHGKTEVVVDKPAFEVAHNFDAEESLEYIAADSLVVGTAAEFDSHTVVAVDIGVVDDIAGLAELAGIAVVVGDYTAGESVDIAVGTDTVAVADTAVVLNAPF